MIKASVDYFTTRKNIRKQHIFGLVPRNANLKGGKCQYLHIRINCLEIQNQVLQNNRQISHIKVLFASVEHHSIPNFWETFLTSPTLRTEKARNL